MTAEKLLALALPLTFVVIVAGAFVRLSDAGLACPDWPGCYGQLLGVPDRPTAGAHSPAHAFDARKAWVEVAHRYLAALLGVIFCLAAFAGRRARLPWVLVLLTAFQAFLGMLTVTDLLRPIVVALHLLGALLILSLLAFHFGKNPLAVEPTRPLRIAGGVAAACLTVQIFLGVWVSGNYAGLACPDIPWCHGGILPPTADFAGFDVRRQLHKDASGAPLSAAALTTIHWTHRAGALLLTAAAAIFAFLLHRARAVKAALGLILLLLLQIALGAANVALHLPLAVSLAHSIGNALLVIYLAALLAKLKY